MYTNHPSLGETQSNLTFNGNVAVSGGLLNSEYRFFGMHKHGDKACGKAWHHEDRFDPGDMSKCYVIMEIIDGQLHMKVHMVDGLPDENDPDLTAEPAVETDAADCEIDAKVGRNPGDWEISVYSRR
ncbi:MAG: hypothetical protein U0929_18395 [Planctomycetaceae bacterium]